MALVLAVLAWFQESSQFPGWLSLTAALIFAVGTVMPGMLRRPFILGRRLWHWLAALYRFRSPETVASSRTASHTRH
jgi:hypothetical protein